MALDMLGMDRSAAVELFTDASGFADKVVAIRPVHRASSPCAKPASGVTATAAGVDAVCRPGSKRL
eukprot:6518116-Pyramimonas_sp.AAC.1